MAKLTVKRDPVLLAFAGVLVVCTSLLVGFHIVTFKEAAAFLMGALALPGLFGSNPEKDDDAQVR